MVNLLLLSLPLNVTGGGRYEISQENDKKQVYNIPPLLKQNTVYSLVHLRNNQIQSRVV